MPYPLSRTFLRRTLLVLCFLPSAWAAATAVPEPLDRQEAFTHFNDLMRAGKRAEALPVCRQYTAAFPDDPAMLYNLACLENTDGDPDQAIIAFQAALAAGFAEYDLAATDPDLQGRIHATIQELSEADQRRLAELSRRQGLTLDLDAWSEPRSLLAAGGSDRGGAFSEPQLRLQWHQNALEFELTADSDWGDVISRAKAAPWNGGPGLMLSLSIPDGTSAWESQNHFLFAFGIEAKGGIGGMFVASQGHWQPVVELAPKIRVDADGQLHLTGLIPWPMLMPFDPVVDTPLGLNATLVLAVTDADRLASLVDTRDTLSPLAKRRRFAPLNLRTDSISGDVLRGKLATSLSSDRPLQVDLVLISTESGPATLSLNFMDQAGRSVLPQGPVTSTISVQQGTNRLTRQADFSGLSDGGYVVQAEIGFPSGGRETWSATVLQLAPRWRAPYEERVSLVAYEEQATVRHLLDTVEAAVETHQPRRSPGAIVATLLDLDKMLADAEETGTILPDKGSFVFVYPGPQAQDRLCRMYLPAGRDIADGLNPILALSSGSGVAARLAERIGRNYEHGKLRPRLKTGNDDRFPVYLVPELQPDAARSADQLFAEAEACRRWAMEFFGSPGVSLAGIDALGGTALRIAGRAARDLRGVQLFAGGGLDPWPQAQPAFIRAQLAPAPADLPVSWVEFTMETDTAGQAREILQAMKDLGYRISEEQQVRGSLNPTQVADRLVLWAEGLR
jgi:hypothetical protein